jgi:hypothetical protein
MRCAGKAALIGATVTMVTAGFGTALLAAVTNITFNPNPIIVGYSVNYTAVEDGTHPPAISYEWSYRCINNWSSPRKVDMGLLIAAQRS